MAEVLIELTASGESGRPVLLSGDKILVKTGRTLRLGDLGVFFVGDKVVCHRVIGIRRDGHYRFKGDANHWSDGWVSAKGVVGRVVGVNGTRFSRWHRPLALGRAWLSLLGLGARHWIFLSPVGQRVCVWKRRCLGNRFSLGPWLGLRPKV